MQQPLVFFTDLPLSDVTELAEDYPLRQTQALIIVLDEIEAWLEQSKTSFGTAPLPCLKAHREWLDAVEHCLDEVREAIEDEDEDVLAGRLSADDGLYDLLDSLIDDCPSDDEITDRLRNKALAETLVSLTRFWVEQVQHQLKRLMSHLCGDGEVLGVIRRQQKIASLYR